MIQHNGVMYKLVDGIADVGDYVYAEFREVCQVEATNGTDVECEDMILLTHDEYQLMKPISEVD